MHLRYCSMTGADDAVNVDDLSALADTYPFLECAILLNPEQSGLPRCPTDKWIVDFSKSYRGKNKAMHLCGEALFGFITGKNEVLALMSGFRRIQLNLKFGDVEGKYDPKELVARAKSSPQWEFIFQYGKDKKALLPLFKDVPNHAVLFDESAGRGVSPDSWEAPLEGHFCGYAGGMNPENVAKNLEMISKVAGGKTTWIDMETGIRTDDRFDLNKVRRVLEIAAPYAVKS